MEEEEGGRKRTGRTTQRVNVVLHYILHVWNNIPALDMGTIE